MKYFFLGLGTFLIYAFICLYGLHYFVSSNDVVVSFSDDDKAISIDSSSNEISEPISFEDYVPATGIDTLVTDSMYTKTEEVVDSLFAADTTTISTDSINNESVIQQEIVKDTTPQLSQAAIDNLKKHQPALFGIYDDLGNKLVSCKSYAVVFEDEPKVKIPYACRRYGLVLKDMLDSDPRSSVLVTTYYGARESKATGESRALYVQKLLNKAGISSQRIFSIVEQENINFNEKKVAYGGVNLVVATTYSIKEKIKRLEKIAAEEQAARKALLSKMFTSSFENNTFNISTEFTKHVKEVKEYLSNHTDKRIHITSFIKDNDGSEETLQLINDNADLAKTSMLVLGIQEEQIELTDTVDDSNRPDENCILLTIK